MKKVKERKTVKKDVAYLLHRLVSLIESGDWSAETIKHMHQDIWLILEQKSS